ncbi:oxidoreductase [Paraburkholderia acidisoli]|uniref:Oxidoreductase n=1 Tax=Paraburkholderia acidisoli TaxID=2571748 RepID=A0A7Z2GQX9_9BURK|nr:oxidoreductase [Paraburkholderia acidisoli]QGZ66288.1 oxidoreductase [Paraburkholderia acidisoli]
MAIDQKLREFASERQIAYLDAIEKHGSQRAAADALGVSRGTVGNAIVSLQQKAAKMGYSPEHDWTHVVPDGFRVQGVSTYYDDEGKPRGQWVKSAVDHNRAEELVREAVSVLSENVRGLAPITESPKRVLGDLLCVYPFGDPHVGLYVWAKECGEAFDLEIGRRLTLGAVDRLVSSAPPAETAILLLLGDVFHADDGTNRTPQHHNPLDVDSRYVKVLQVGIETYRHAILRALEKHARVVVKAIPGNHDPHAIWSLAFTLSAYFSNESRVEVDLGPAKHWYYRFGKVLIGSTHGDTTKHGQLGGIMACDRAKDWGETLYRYWYTGHIHSKSVTELPGVLCESFRTLAAQDSYAAGHGYRAGRDMQCIVHHREFGEIERHRCDVGMLEAA